MPRASLAITNWRFNAWAKYDNWHNDDLIPEHVAKLYGMRSFEPQVKLADGTEQRLVLEGGSIDTNGAGVLLTTEECLLSEVQQRNPGVSREQLEQAFAEYLGIEKVIWLNRGCAGDDTHGHVDDISRFVGENTILTAVEENTADENHLPLAENLERLHAARNLRGEPFEIKTLPMPAPVVFEGPAPARELREFLHRQWVGAGADVQRPERSNRTEHACRVLPGSRCDGHPLHGLHLGLGRAALHDPAGAGAEIATEGRCRT